MFSKDTASKSWGKHRDGSTGPNAKNKKLILSLAVYIFVVNNFKLIVSNIPIQHVRFIFSQLKF